MDDHSGSGLGIENRAIRQRPNFRNAVLLLALPGAYGATNLKLRLKKERI